MDIILVQWLSQFLLAANSLYLYSTLKRINIILLFIGWLACASGQEMVFQFTHITEKDGLSENQVTFLLKDSFGGLWISTSNGLNYFDGYNFRVYQNSADSNSILNNAILGLCEDRKGNIWGGTELGIFCFERDKGRFRNYYYPATLIGKLVWNVICDDAGDIWGNGWEHLVKLNQKTQRLEAVAGIGTAMGANDRLMMRFNCMQEDPSGKGIWLATQLGIKYYNKQTASLEDARKYPDNPVFSSNDCQPISKGQNGSMLYYDREVGEIVRFDPVTKQQKERIATVHATEHRSGISIFESSDGKIWFGTYPHEVYVIDTRQQHTIQQLKSKLDKPFSISGNVLFQGLEDEDHSVWLATSNGISKWNAEKALYKLHNLGQTVVALMNDISHINYMIRNPKDESVWIATNNNWVINYNLETGAFRQFNTNRLDLVKSRPGHRQIMQLFPLGNSVVVCHEHSEPLRVEMPSGKVSAFNQLPAASRPYFANSVTSSDSINFYFTDSKSVLLYNALAGSVKNLSILDPASIQGKSDIGHLFKKKGQPAWAANSIGWLMAFGEKLQDSVQILRDKEKEFHGYFSWLDTDAQGHVWITVKGIGLYRFDPISRSITRWTQAEGLITNHISTAIPDARGNIWCADRVKFSVLIPATGYCYNFTLPSQIESSVWYNRLVSLKNGHIISGIYKDLVEFFPERLFQKPVLRTPVISSIKINNEARVNAPGPALQLRPNENEVSFQFGSLIDNSLFPYFFSYKLEGFDKEARIVEGRPEAVYKNLPPGAYTFRLQCMGKDGSWSTPWQTLQFSIARPFYKSNWFILLLSIISLAMLYFIYFFRLQQKTRILSLEAKTEALEKEKTMIKYESLKQHLNPHFLFNSLTSLRSLIKSDAKNAAAFLDGMSKVYRYVLRSAEQELVPLHDEVAFIKVFAQLQQVRFGNGLVVSVNVPEKDMGKKVAPVVLQNLVENAIKHNTTSTRSPLVVDIFTENDYLVVRNNLQRYRVVETSNKSGLKSLKSLYAFYTQKPIEIDDTPPWFIIRIPLI